MNVRSVVACPVPSACACLALFLAGPPRAFPQPSWQSLSPGLELARFGDPPITVVRVDPTHYEFRLLSAKVLGLKTTPTAPEWVARKGVVGVINASMFQADHLSVICTTGRRPTAARGAGQGRS
jgi:hypothetical protein